MHKSNISFIFLIVLLLMPQIGLSQDDEGEIFIDPNQPEIDSLLIVAKNDTTNTEKARLYNRIAFITSDNDTCIKYANLSLEYCTAIDDSMRFMAVNYENIGVSYYMKDESRKALPYYFKAVDLYSKYSNTKDIAKIYTNIGNCYEDLNIKDSIFYYYNKAVVILTEIKDTNYLILTHKGLGRIYLDLYLYDNAEDNYRKALKYATSKNDIFKMAECYSKIGEVYLYTNKCDLAVEYLTKAVHIFESANNNRSDFINRKYLTYSWLANVYIKMANETGKNEYADSCYSYYKKIGNYYLTNGSIYNYIENYVYIQYNYLIFYRKYHEALAVLLRAEKYMKDNTSINLYETYYESLYDIYSTIGDYKNALKYHKKYMEYRLAFINDSTLNTIKDAEVERARMIDSVNHRHETLRIKAEHEQEIKRKQGEVYIILSVFAVVLLVSVILFRWYRTNKQKNELMLKHKALEIERTLLRTQMNPHFIFNALNSIQNFIVSNNSLDAERYLSKFAKLMRMILDNSMKQNITLDNELLSLTLYIDLEKARFNNRFTYQINIDDNIEEDLILVPAMLIQPFVENAILHGLLHKNDDNGLITIDITENPDKHLLTCSITDNGIGRKAAAEYSKTNKGHHSVGMQLTRDRLKDLNKETEGISCNIEDLYDSSGNALGTKVTILIPYTEDV